MWTTLRQLVGRRGRGLSSGEAVEEPFRADPQSLGRFSGVQEPGHLRFSCGVPVNGRWVDLGFCGVVFSGAAAGLALVWW